MLLTVAMWPLLTRRAGWRRLVFLGALFGFIGSWLGAVHSPLRLIEVAGWLAAATGLRFVLDWSEDTGPELRLLGGVLVFGMLLRAALAAAPFVPGLSPGAYDALPPRLLRLAAAASVALPALALHFIYLEGGSRGSQPVARWCLVGGAALMPLILTGAALAHPAMKYLLFIPADAVVVGVALACRAALRQGLRTEAAAWGLLAATLVAGLFAGAYSFEGPLPAPPRLDRYAYSARSALREAHTGIVLSALSVLFVVRFTSPERRPSIVSTLLVCGALLVVLGPLVAGALAPVFMLSLVFAVLTFCTFGTSMPPEDPGTGRAKG